MTPLLDAADAAAAAEASMAASAASAAAMTAVAAASASWKTFPVFTPAHEVVLAAEAPTANVPVRDVEEGAEFTALLGLDATGSAGCGKSCG